METIVYAFSGTGNSLYAAKRVASALDAKVKYIVHEAKEGHYKCEAGRVIFVFPVYAWGPPAVVKYFMEKLDLSQASYISALATAASSTGATFGIVADILAAKGKPLNYACTIMMPTNYLPLFTVKPAGKCAKKLEKADKKISKYLEDIKAAVTARPYKAGFLAKKFYSFVYDKNSKKDKNFFVDPVCIKCGVCAKVCPAHDIEITDAGPVWQGKCMQCMACANYCPTKVIQIKRAFTSRQGRYHHPGVTDIDIAAQK
ncbi:ferredoxin [Elusimicrobium simillimum]|uniref:EFR1 family ferrodoxin n=1 Tax=Elusimicrobium simillimum TaxID=3143438 RepID=UPI003C6EC538